MKSQLHLQYAPDLETYNSFILCLEFLVVLRIARDIGGLQLLGHGQEDKSLLLLCLFLKVRRSRKLARVSRIALGRTQEG